MSDWREVRIRDVATTFDGPHATPRSTKIATSGPIFLGISSLSSGRLDLSQSAFLSENDFVQWTRRVTPTEGDVVFSYETRLGEAAIIPAGFRGSLGRRLAVMRPNRELVDPRFLLYSYLSPAFQEVIRQNTVHGSTVDRIMLKEFPDFPLALPPLPEQRAIAATLGALDDKIESNRRAIETGERLLRSKVLLAIDTSSGDEGVLSDYCGLVNATVKTGSIDPSANYIGFEHMPRGSVFLNAWSTAEGLGSHKTAFQAGDLLFGKLRPYFKKVGIAPVAGVCSTDILVIRPKNPRDLGLITCVAASDALIDSLSASSTGTRMPRASWNDLASWPVPKMTEAELVALADDVSPLIARLEALTFESQRLAALRDALLPELLSGSSRVPAGEAAG